MPSDPLSDRREFAGECLALAKQTQDLKIRASLLDMAQKWLELASERPDPHRYDSVLDTFKDQQLQAARPKH
jgi:hypothetical protein